MTLALDRLKPLLDSFADEIANMGNFPSLFLGTVNADGGLEYYDGPIRIVDGEGNSVADGPRPARYFTYLGEASEDYSFVKFPFYQPFGYPHGHYRVGPLARLNVAKFAGTERRRPRNAGVQAARGSGAVCESFHYHLARLIEMLHCVERIEELMSDRGSVRAKRSRPRHRSTGGKASGPARRRAALCSIIIGSTPTD